jgi:hypothetical protein
MAFLRMIGQTISHYRIVEKLRGGGMGVVYKTQGIKLGSVLLPSRSCLTKFLRMRKLSHASNGGSLTSTDWNPGRVTR